MVAGISQTSAFPARTVVLIGATGFIGRRIAGLLVAVGHRVIAPVRASSALRNALPPQAELVPYSLRADDPGLRQSLAAADAVIYAAGAVRGASIPDFLPANVHGITAVANALITLHSSPPPLLLLSSLAASQPQLSDYARSKSDGERVLLDFPQIPTSIFRPPAVYGPGDREMRPLFDLMRRGIAPRIGPPGQRLSLLHVDDLAAAVLAWLAADPTAGHGCLELHDGHQEGYLLEEIAATTTGGKAVRLLPVPAVVLAATAQINHLLSRLTGRAPMLTPGKTRELRHHRWTCDNAAITAALGWKPQIPLRIGLAGLYPLTA